MVVRTLIVACLCLLAAACGPRSRASEVVASSRHAHQAPALEHADAAWDGMKRVLQGTFRATTTDGRAITTSYRTFSRESALVETFTTASGTETLSVFHRDGQGLMLTHYCGQGNQARLRAVAASREAIVFELADATNVKPDQGVMQKLVVTFRDGGFDQESVYLDAGKLDTTTLQFRRAAPGEGEVSYINAELRVTRVGADAFVVTHEPFHSSNVLVVRMPDGTVVFCSSPFETEATRALVQWVQSALRPTKMIAINTHFHLDGTAGNDAYREMGVTTYASDRTQALLAEKGALVQKAAAEGFDAEKRRRILETRIVAAEKTFPALEGLTFSFGGEAVRVVYPGPAHAPDNVLVFFPARALLFGGCMIKSSRSIGYVGHADLDHWEAAVEIARSLRPEVVIPGHGSGRGPELFDLTVAVVRDARAHRAK